MLLWASSSSSSSSSSPPSSSSSSSSSQSCRHRHRLSRGHRHSVHLHPYCRSSSPASTSSQRFRKDQVSLTRTRTRNNTQQRQDQEIPRDSKNNISRLPRLLRTSFSVIFSYLSWLWALVRTSYPDLAPCVLLFLSGHLRLSGAMAQHNLDALDYCLLVYPLVNKHSYWKWP